MVTKFRIAAAKLALAAVLAGMAGTAFAQTHTRHVTVRRNMMAYCNPTTDHTSAQPTDGGSLVQSVRGIEGIPQ